MALRVSIIYKERTYLAESLVAQELTCNLITRI